MAEGNGPKWMGQAIFGLTVFLVFLSVFESFLSLPDLVAWLGRWHPVVLHFPVVLLLLAAVLGLWGKKIPGPLLGLAVLSALVTAITGFFLGTGPGPKEGPLFWHQWMGTAVALLAAGWYWLSGSPWRGRAYVVKGVQGALIALVALTGHYGGMLTHGEDFLALPRLGGPGPIPENPLIYGDIVQRVFEADCTSCHNPGKKKGELSMTALPGLLAGGESGAAIVPGDPGNSELIKRLLLPKEDKGHMPPSGKRPLSGDEVKILERWIALGASDTLRLSHLEAAEPLQGLVTGMMAPKRSDTWASFAEVPDSTLQNLGGDYRRVQRVAGNSRALSVSVFSPPEYDPQLVLDLARVAGNIVELDLSGLPLGEKELELIGLCKNLETLEVDRTGIGDAGFAHLAGLKGLSVLKAYGTQITGASLPVLKGLTGLRSLYLWETPLSDSGGDALGEALPLAHIDRGIAPELLLGFVQKDTLEVGAAE